ncbi:MAG: PEP/pyruvate-binding domain-containing protein, partial [Actinomycetota bacterium]
MVVKDKTKEQILWFDDIGIHDVPLVGGKSASLGEMTSTTHVPVPFGFATTATAYWHFIDTAGLKNKIGETLAVLNDPEDTDSLRKVGKAARNMIMRAKMPADLENNIKKFYRELAKKVGEKEPYVAVRSSATAEDLPDASFAGQQETYLNVHGETQVVEKIKECYSSLFTDRVIYYRTQKGFDHMAVALSATVQMMVYSKAAGV